MTYADLPLLAQGYCHALIDNESNGDNAADWVGIGPDDFSPGALEKIDQDCRRFLEAAYLDPRDEDDDDDYFDEISNYDLGWYLYLERQGVGVGFADAVEGELRDRLIEAVSPFFWVTVTVEDGLIQISGTEPWPIRRIPKKNA